MKELLSKGNLSKLKNVHFDMCESCVMGKQKKLSFLTSDKTLRSTKLELVHIDFWDLSLMASLGGSRYYITFINKCSRRYGFIF